MEGTAAGARLRNWWLLARAALRPFGRTILARPDEANDPRPGCNSIPPPIELYHVLGAIARLPMVTSYASRPVAFRSALAKRT
jgi:hypothetical protein